MILYNRAASLIVDNRKFGVRLNFSIVKFPSGGVGADSKITAYNLSQESRNHIQAAANATQNATLTAGYGADTRLLFSGNVFYAHTEREGPDILTILELKGAQSRMRTIVTKFSGLQNDWQIFSQCSKSFNDIGISTGMVSAMVRQQLMSGVYKKGATDSDLVRNILDRIMRKHNLVWNVDNGALNVYHSQEYADSLEVFLSKDTGMIGFPTKADAGNYKVRSLLNPDIQPGKKIKLQSIEAPHPVFLKVMKATHEGDTLEGPWFTEIEALVPGYELQLNGGGQDVQG